jgi:Trk K+ transport system NAD-binding subunit
VAGGKEDMDQRRRVRTYLSIIVGVVVLYTVIYNIGMARWENEPQSIFRSLVVVLETLTTTGFGQDVPRTSTPMLIFVTIMLITGVVLIVGALPVIVAPWLEERFTTVAPTSIDDIENHVVVTGYSPRAQALVEEFRRRDIPYLVVEPDREVAANIYETGTTVIHGDPENADICRDGANLTDARAFIVDVDDETNVSIVLTAKDTCDVPVVTFVEDADFAEYHRLAGADWVYSPRRLIGKSLATTVTAGVSTDLDDAIEIAEDFDIVELPVQTGGTLDGVTIEDSGIREQTGVNVIGAWFHGEFVSSPSPDAYIDDQTILLAAGHEHQLEQLKEFTLTETRNRPEGPIIVCGYDVVGQTVEAAIEEEGLQAVTVDKEDKGVDVVGDVTDTDVLRTAGIGEARTVILALPDDTMTIFATLVIREMNPDIEIIARADAAESVRKCYQAGADYVLSLATVSGRMLASTILEEEIISFDHQIDVIRTRPRALTGQTLREAAIRSRTGCTIVAAKRNGTLVEDLDPSFVFQPNDELVVAGTDADISEFSNILD